MSSSKSIILSDVDGVLLNWGDPFHAYMQYRGYDKVVIPIRPRIEQTYNITREQAHEFVEDFNSSVRFQYLEPMHDSIEAIKKLSQTYEIHLITACSPAHEQRRRKNLREVFGDVFSEIHFAGHDGKTKYFEQYKGTKFPYIEDLPVYADQALGYDLNVLLYNQEYNLDHDFKGLRISRWLEVVELLSGGI